MDVLGYDRYALQGGDWGSFVSSRMAVEYSHRVIGLHLNMMPLPRDPSAIGDATPEQRVWREELEEFLKEETGYQWIQGTRPQTLAYGLTDSPAGLAAWIGEKFRAWSDCGGDVFSAISKDDLLANISLYWFTGAIGSSFWPYYARLSARGRSRVAEPSTCPPHTQHSQKKFCVRHGPWQPGITAISASGR